MQLNLSTDIALRTLIYLGQKKAPATIGEIAVAYGIAKTHLMKVVMTMVARDLVISERGRNGGIRLAHAPSSITVGKVVRLMEPDMALVFCMQEGVKDDACPLLPACRLKKTFHAAQVAFLKALDQTKLSSLI